MKRYSKIIVLSVHLPDIILHFECVHFTNFRLQNNLLDLNPKNRILKSLKDVTALSIGPEGHLGGNATFLVDSPVDNKRYLPRVSFWISLIAI